MGLFTYLNLYLSRTKQGVKILVGPKALMILPIYHEKKLA